MRKFHSLIPLDMPAEADVAKEFLQRVVTQTSSAGLTSDEHSTVDGTLLEAWASLKSIQPKNQKGRTPSDDRGNPTVDFHGERRSNDTHASKTDADAKLARKGLGKEAKLSYSGNLLVENRNWPPESLISCISGGCLRSQGRSCEACNRGEDLVS